MSMIPLIVSVAGNSPVEPQNWAHPAARAILGFARESLAESRTGFAVRFRLTKAHSEGAAVHFGEK